jgi:predicted nucleic acid-binding protein
LYDLAEAAFLVTLPAETPAIVSDPDDDPILQTAIAGRADVLCSRDRAFRAAAVDLVCAAHEVRVLDDIELMRELREEGAPPG